MEGPWDLGGAARSARTSSREPPAPRCREARTRSKLSSVGERRRSGEEGGGFCCSLRIVAEECPRASERERAATWIRRLWCLELGTWNGLLRLGLGRPAASKISASGERAKGQEKAFVSIVAYAKPAECERCGPCMCGHDQMRRCVWDRGWAPSSGRA